MRWLRRLLTLAVLGLIVAAGLVYMTWPEQVAVAEIPAHTPDAANGKIMFDAGGCQSCHAGTEQANAELPSGGKPLATPAGTFYPPNITPDRGTGIGGWSDAQFLTAMARGASPGSQHYFPAFPFTSYANMRPEDLLDLKAHLMTLTPVSRANTAHEVPFLPVARLAMGGWKLVAGSSLVHPADPSKGEAWNRGAYLAQGPGHCGECHTPRNLLMAMDTSRFLSGGPHPEGKGRVPSLRGLVARGRYKDADDLASALRFGEAFGYEDISSGGMGDVQANLAKLPEEDVKAIAAFLMSLE